MTRFAVLTCKNRIFAHRRSSDGTVPRRGSFYRKNSPVFQVKTRESKAKNTPILRGGLKKDQQSI